MLGAKGARHLAYGIFAILGVIVVLTFRHYGVTWDEELQSRYGLAVRDYYATFFKDGRYAQIFNLYLYGGMFDGLAAVVEPFVPYDLYDVRHFLNAVFGLLGLWGVWKLGRFLGGDRAALVALILCAATPSYYGHMFSNPKDIPFAAGIVWSIYHMSRAYVNPASSTLLKLGIVLGLTLGVRVGGVMVFAYWLVPMGIVALLPLLKRRDPQTLRDIAKTSLRLAFGVVLPVGLLAYVIMLICWPWAQQAPIANPLRALSEFSDFPQDVEVLLNGITYRSTELPWFYVPMYFGIQLPETMLVLLASAIVFIPRAFASMTIPQRQSLTLVLMMAFVPVLYATVRHPALYDTVRHFLFVIPLASVVAALAAREIYTWFVSRSVSPKLVDVAMGLAFFVATGTQAIAMVRLHPYEYIYANNFVGGAHGAYGRFETEYWGASFKEAAEKLQAYMDMEGGVPPGKIYKVAICGPWSSATIYMEPNFKPVVANEPAEFFIATTRWMCQNMRAGKEIIRIERLGAPLAVVKDLRNGFEYYEGNKNDWSDTPILPR
jgi:hypothetical protein